MKIPPLLVLNSHLNVLIFPLILCHNVQTQTANYRFKMVELFGTTKVCFYFDANISASKYT